MSTTRAEWEMHATAYHHFMLGLKWFAIHLAALIFFLTIWFCTPGGFWWGLLMGAIVFGIGVWAMNHGLAHSTEAHPPGPEDAREA